MMNPRFHMTAIAAVTILAAAPFAQAADLPDTGEEPVVVFGGWGGSVQKQMYEFCFDEFTAKTGIKVEYFNTARLGKLKAQVESGQPEMDTTWLNGIEMPAATGGNYVQKLHYDVIDKSELSPNQYNHAFGEYGITFDIFTEAMAYNTNKWPGDDHPKSWADFWDVEKFPGPRAMDGRPPLNGAFEAASRAMGIPAKNVYPIDLDKAYAKLDEIKPHVAIWLKRGSEHVKAMVSEEVDMILAFSGRIAEAARKGAPFRVVPQTYIRTTGSLFVVPAKAKHPRNASLLIGYCARKEPMAKFAAARAGAPSNMMAIDLMDKSMVPSNHPSLADTTVVVDDQWYAPRLADLNKQWTEWVTR